MKEDTGLQEAQKREAERMTHQITVAVSTLRSMIPGRLAFDALSAEIAQETRTTEREVLFAVRSAVAAVNKPE